MTLVWTLIVPRALGPVDFGILVSAQSVSGVLGLALGIGAQTISSGKRSSTGPPDQASSGLPLCCVLR